MKFDDLNHFNHRLENVAELWLKVLANQGLSLSCPLHSASSICTHRDTIFPTQPILLLSSLLKMSQPVQVPSSAEQKTISSYIFPSQLYLAKTSNCVSLDTCVDISNCMENRPLFFTLSMSQTLMSFAMSPMRLAIVSVDTGIVSSVLAILSPRIALVIAITAGVSGSQQWYGAFLIEPLAMPLHMKLPGLWQGLQHAH